MISTWPPDLQGREGKKELETRVHMANVQGSGNLIKTLGMTGRASWLAKASVCLKGDIRWFPEEKALRLCVWDLPKPHTTCIFFCRLTMVLSWVLWLIMVSYWPFWLVVSWSDIGSISLWTIPFNLGSILTLSGWHILSLSTLNILFRNLRPILFLLRSQMLILLRCPWM